MPIPFCPATDSQPSEQTHTPEESSSAPALPPFKVELGVPFTIEMDETSIGGTVHTIELMMGEFEMGIGAPADMPQPEVERMIDEVRSLFRAPHHDSISV